MFIGLILALLLDPLWAKEQVYLSNIDHSNISFKVKFLEISEVQGTFEKFKSEFHFDPKTKVISDIKLSISSSSINTGNKKRDLHLRRKDFLNVKKYPDIFFESEGSVNLSKTDTVAGTLHVMGKQLPFNIRLKYLGQKRDTWEKQNYFFEFSGALNRQEIGLNWNKTLDAGGFVVGDQVQLFGNVQAQLQGQRTVFSRFLIPDSETIRQREKISRGEIEVPSKPSIVLENQNIEKEKKTQPPLKENKKIAINKEKIEKQGSVINADQLSSWQVAGYVVVGFYGFIGAIALALLVQFINRKEKIQESGYKKFFRESLFDSLSIIVIVPYALAMWTYMFF